VLIGHAKTNVVKKYFEITTHGAKLITISLFKFPYFRR
jgi:hypothetical protein